MSAPPKPNREPRFEAAFRVRYKTMDDLVIAYSKNLSKGGLFLRTERFLPVNSMVRLHMELPDDGGELLLECRVVYVTDPKATGKPGPAGMGIQFLDPNDEARGRIERFIAEFSFDSASESTETLRPPKPLDVLVVDDDKAYCEVAGEPFKRRGDSVRVAHDGIEALALCIKQPPDVILCDVQMPRMDGWQFLRVIRARAGLEKVPFLFLTTLGGEADRLRGYRLGVDDYIPKPYRPAEVVARTDRALSRAQRASPAEPERSMLRGDLEQVGVASILSFLDLERKTGVVRISGETVARVFLRTGSVVRVEMDGPRGSRAPKELLFELLDTKKGRFAFTAEDVGSEDTIGLRTTSLLLEHAQRRDERR